MQGCVSLEPSNSLLEGLSQTLSGMGQPQVPWDFCSQECLIKEQFLPDTPSNPVLW